MKIDTTINIRKEFLERIDATAKEFSVSRSTLISLLLLKSMRSQISGKNCFSRVRYQKRDKEVEWKRPHLFLDQHIYEKSLDLRKLQKLSVSYLVVISFQKFFNEVVMELSKKVDNVNVTRQYICIGKSFNGIYSYVVFWEYPPEKILNMFLE